MIMDIVRKEEFQNYGLHIIEYLESSLHFLSEKKLINLLKLNNNKIKPMNHHLIHHILHYLGTFARTNNLFILFFIPTVCYIIRYFALYLGIIYVLFYNIKHFDILFILLYNIYLTFDQRYVYLC